MMIHQPLRATNVIEGELRDKRVQFSARSARVPLAAAAFKCIKMTIDINKFHSWAYAAPTIRIGKVIRQSVT